MTASMSKKDFGPILSVVGRSLGKSLANSAVEEFKLAKNFEGLKNSVQKAYGWEEGFTLHVKDGKLQAGGKCPVYKLTSVWCEHGCETFAEAWADAFGFGVKRTTKQPEDEICTFLYEKT